jgi:UDP-N-acetylmuramoyl-L-alanyl-D-glutamate--2,6-diaminopimelate ligase
MLGYVKDIKGLSADSRDIKKGFLFAALSGVRFDGRDFMDQAVINGATHILAQTGTRFPEGVVEIESDHPRRDFARLAAAFYNAQPDHIIAVTGTNGKTSVAEFCRQIFELSGYKSASLGTLGLVSHHVSGQNVMTTPDPVKLHALLADLKAAGVDHLAMEASSHGLDQHRLDGVTPKVAAFTNLSQDHLDYHGDMDRYFAAKARLFHDILPDDGTAIINADDKWGQQLLLSLRGGKADATIQGPQSQPSDCFAGARNDIISFGTNDNADMRLLSQTPTSRGQDISMSYQGEKHDFSLSLIGKFQAMNVLCAAACAIAADIDSKVVFEVLPHLKGVRGRMELAAAVADRAAYIDYAHTPDALENALKSLRPHVRNRLVCVFGAGGDRDKGKRPLMGKAAQDYADMVIITDDNPRSEDPEIIRNHISSACSSAENIGGRRDAIAHAVSILNAGDVLLVAGKGHEQGQTIGDTTHPFDDLSITQELMEARFRT